MKKAFVSLLLALAAFSVMAQRSRVVTDSLASRKLSCVQKFNVYLPAGYDPARSYPVLYLLHGLYGCYLDWTSAGHMKEVTDQLMASGEACPMVIVMPNAGHADVHHYQNGYFNVPDWPYEDFFFQEFLPEVERRYHCGGSKGQRAVAGLSMGGGGTIVYAQRHPDLFSSAYGMSAWLDNESDQVNVPAQEGSKLRLTARSVRDHSALRFLDEADSATLAALRTVRWFLDCGDDDFLLQLSLDLHMKMRAADVKSELRVRDGSHSWEYWHSALPTALPFASRNFFCPSSPRQ